MINLVNQEITEKLFFKTNMWQKTLNLISGIWDGRFEAMKAEKSAIQS